MDRRINTTLIRHLLGASLLLAGVGCSDQEMATGPDREGSDSAPRSIAESTPVPALPETLPGSKRSQVDRPKATTALGDDFAPANEAYLMPFGDPTMDRQRPRQLATPEDAQASGRGLGPGTNDEQARTRLSNSSGVPALSRLGDSAPAADHEPLDDLDPETEHMLSLLDLPDPNARAQAAQVLDPEGIGLEHLIDVLANDPDPHVRAAATVSLENADNFAALQAIVFALNDPNPEVVLAAIDSIEFAGDASNVLDLEPLLVHRDLRVQEAASEAIEFLE